MPHPLRNRLLLLSGRRTYAQKVLGISPGLLAYWPLSESSGTTITDLSGNARHGTYTGVDLGQTGIGDGRTAPLWDGVNDYGNVYSAGLAGAFNGSEGTAHLWVRVAGVGVWSDGVSRRALNLEVSASNLMRLRTNTANNGLLWDYVSGSTTSSVTVGSLTSVAWIPLALTWSKAADQMKAYMNGSQVGTTQTGLGTWAGALGPTLTNIGARLTTPTVVWSGTLAHVALWSTPLSAAQIASLAVL